MARCEAASRQLSTLPASGQRFGVVAIADRQVGGALPSGSYLAIAHLTADFMDADQVAAYRVMKRRHMKVLEAAAGL